MDDNYLTIAEEAAVEIKIKGSRFVGESFKAVSPAEAAAKLDLVRKRDFTASHHCYAWQVSLLGGQKYKHSDDGEPSGTAGKPIFSVIAGRGLTNLLVVVTRYFGGTKLGTGGLVRAYSDTAGEVLNLSGICEQFITRCYRVELGFSQYDRWQRLLHDLGAKVLDQTFSDEVAMNIEIRQGRADELMTTFAELTGGKGKIEEIGGG